MGLSEKFNQLQSKYTFLETYPKAKLYTYIRESLTGFLSRCATPAVWCYGSHTRMLMADFIFEMKKVKFIIDGKYEQADAGGFCVIHEDRILECGIDGIVISSYQYREEIRAALKEKYAHIKYLDFYEELENQGILLNGAYYTGSHPYASYKKINRIKRRLLNNEKTEELLQSLIREYVNIRDFQSAARYAEALVLMGDYPLYRELKQDLEEIYQLELSTLSSVSAGHTVLFCMDGLRRQDVLNGSMPRLKQYLTEYTHFYTNAYSVSTSTYESLIPAYGENDDLRTKYYISNTVPEKDCRFIREAVKQGRGIHFYTDSTKYVESDRIQVTELIQTATEKIWDFIMDADVDKEGLFYVHVLYESHYSYPNPDTESELIADGTNIMFDYLERNGGRLRTDYERQHRDTVQYLDRVITPFLRVLPCRMVFYADHGNILLPPGMPLDEIAAANFSCHEDLIQIPMAIRSPEMPVVTDDSLISLMDFNEIVCSLLYKQRFEYEPKHFIKIQRSAIYNPDFQYIYHKAGKDQELKAFETFIFENGYKLTVYEDGFVRLCDRLDEPVEDQGKAPDLWNKVYKHITVTDRPLHSLQES